MRSKKDSIVYLIFLSSYKRYKKEQPLIQIEAAAKVSVELHEANQLCFEVLPGKILISRILKSLHH